MNHCCVLYQSDRYEKGKLVPINESFVDNCIQLYIARFKKEPNRIYGSVLIDKENYVQDDSIAPYLVYIGHTDDIGKIHDKL